MVITVDAAHGAGEEALAMLAEQAFDVVVSHMGMGAGINGGDLAGCWKKRLINSGVCWRACSVASAFNCGIEEPLSSGLAQIEIA